MNILKLKTLIDRFKFNDDVTHIKILSVRNFIDITEILKDPTQQINYKLAKVDSFKIVKDCLVIVVYKWKRVKYGAMSSAVMLAELLCREKRNLSS